MWIEAESPSNLQSLECTFGTEINAVSDGCRLSVVQVDRPIHEGGLETAQEIQYVRDISLATDDPNMQAACRDSSYFNCIAYPD